VDRKKDELSKKQHGFRSVVWLLSYLAMGLISWQFYIAPLGDYLSFPIMRQSVMIEHVAGSSSRPSGGKNVVTKTLKTWSEHEFREFVSNLEEQ